MKKKVLLGMSGGVDSSVSAILLKQAGYEVIGATMNLWVPEESNCCESQAVHDAKRVCDKLEIPHYILNFKEEFKCKVVDKFISEYKNAKTPNPCVECNKYLKFGAFYQKAKDLGCDYIATGHYAKTEFSEKYNRYVLKMSEEVKKDQTYFLYTIPKEEIKHILFPLQNLKTKLDTRKIATEYNLEVAQKNDSQEICFILNDDYKSFLSKYINNIPGNFVLASGEILGKHTGITNYTIGQRKGLGIAYKEPLYVININTEKNEIILGEEKELYSKELIANELNWLIFDKLENNFECYAKIRYRSKAAKANIIIQDENNVKVIFNESQRAITKGQSVVFYDEDGIVIGGGKIC